MRVTVFAIALVIAASTLAYSQEAQQSQTGGNAVGSTKTPVINQRQKRQQHRINQGIKSGQLTPGETARLEAREAKIQADKKIAKSDGVVTPKERAHIQREQNRASKSIYRKKHNARTQ